MRISSSQTATITCHCGKVKLTLPNAVPKFRSGCCCTECLQRAYLACDGKPPAAVRNLEEPVDILYIDSQVMKPNAETLARLTVFKLNQPDASNVNLRATCCGAVLCTENDKFHVPHSMATFNNLRPFLKCEFSEVPAPTANLFTKDWPEDLTMALLSRERSTKGKVLPQIHEPSTALEEQPILELISALGTAAQEKPENSISFDQLCDGMEMTIETAFFNEARAHLPVA